MGRSRRVLSWFPLETICFRPEFDRNESPSAWLPTLTKDGLAWKKSDVVIIRGGTPVITLTKRWLVDVGKWPALNILLAVRPPPVPISSPKSCI